MDAAFSYVTSPTNNNLLHEHLPTAMVIFQKKLDESSQREAEIAHVKFGSLMTARLLGLTGLVNQ